MSSLLDGPVPFVCPECHGRLLDDAAGGVACSACGAAFPRRAQVPVFLDEGSWDGANSTDAKRRDLLVRYRSSRRDSPLTVQYFDQWVASMLEQIPQDVEGPLVELMCGDAEVSRRAPARFSPVLALDLSPSMAEGASRALAALDATRFGVVCGSAARVPVATGSVAAVVVQSALHHARPLLREIFSEIGRILRPGGIFVGTEPANDNALVTALRHWQYRRSSAQGLDEDEDGITRDEVALATEGTGLRLVEYRRFGFLAFPLMANTQLFPLLARTRSLGLGRMLMAFDRLAAALPLVRSLALQSSFAAVREPRP